MLFKKIVKILLKPNNKPNIWYRFLFYKTSHCFKFSLLKRNVSKSDKILDVGCRRLLYSKDLDCLGLIGIDLLSESGGLLGWTSESLKNINREKISLYIANAEELPFPSNSFSLVILIEVIEHIRNDQKAISEISRVLRKNGKLILSTPNGDYIPNTNPFHLRHYSQFELEKLLKKFFNIVQIQSKFPWISLHEKQNTEKLFKRTFYILVNKLFEITIGKFFKNRGYTLFAICEKPNENTYEQTLIDQKIPIICPVCKGNLVISKREIKCQECHNTYSYYHQIPVLLSKIHNNQKKNHNMKNES